MNNIKPNKAAADRLAANTKIEVMEFLKARIGKMACSAILQG